MPGPRSVRLVETVLHCYPTRWRSRHGDEAAELATLLMRDGMPARSIAWSYLVGAARERLVPHGLIPHGLIPRRGRGLGTVLGALLVTAGSLSVSLSVLPASAAAHAASVVSGRHARPRGGLRMPGDWCYVAGGRALTPAAASIHNPARPGLELAGGHGEHC
jgi:hypothetical protein